MQPSMELAASIRDRAARHAYVFDNGLSSPDFFDVPKRMASEEFALLKQHCQPEHSIFEVGCLTGLNLLGLAELGYRQLSGLDFVCKAVEWLNQKAQARRVPIDAHCCTFPGVRMQPHVDRVICFDVLEHQLNVGTFLEAVQAILNPGGQCLILVPEGRHYYDCGHTAFFPDVECLRNVLDYYFDVKSAHRLETCEKLFAVCELRSV